MIIAFLILLGHNFGGKICGCTTHSLRDMCLSVLCQGAKDGITDSKESDAIDDLSETEVRNFDGGGIFRSQQYVLNGQNS